MSSRTRRSSSARRRWLVASAVVGALLTGLMAGCSTEPEQAAPTSTQMFPGSSEPEPVPGEPRMVAEGLEVPWGIAFLPDGSGFPSGTALVAQRASGDVVLVEPSGALVPVGSVPDVVSSSEGGLLGLAASPDFAQDRAVFAYASTAEDNRIVRFTLDGGAGGAAASMGPVEPVLTGIAESPIHDGGRLRFGPDGMLYASTGDAGVGSRAQDLASLNGKILRMTADGEPAPGNPFADEPFPASIVYSLGHRNVEGLAWDEARRLYATEFGSGSFDEVNLIEPGSNYGWPEVEGVGGDDRFVEPVITWRPSESSPSGIAYAAGALWVGALRGEGLWRIPVADGVVGTPERLFYERYGRIRTVATTPSGSIWFTTSNRDGRGNPSPTDDQILQVDPG